jgi:cytochrome c oxidase cbb3-type subunit 3
MKRGRGVTALLLGLPILLACGCERPPSADHLQEWTPADHDRVEDQANVAKGQQAAQAKGGSGTENLIEITWQQGCATCHGRTGHGDGPSGPMVNPPDLTRADLQASVSDEDIATIIRNGKNRMPKFDLPASVVTGLVAKIRSLRSR